MKRVWVSLSLLAIISAVCAYSLILVTSTKEKMLDDINAITAAAKSEDHDETVWRVESLSAYWKHQESRIMHFVRHDHIDNIAQNVSRLSTLAEYEETAELIAELSSIAWQITHVWQAERPTLKNTF